MSTESADVDDHNRQVSRLLATLGKSGSGRRAVIKAVAELQGIVDADELEDLYSGKAIGKLRVPNDMRETMREIGLSDLFAPVNGNGNGRDPCECRCLERY